MALANFLTFGGIGNSVTDNAPMFDSAIRVINKSTYTKTLFIPAGQYALQSSLTFPSTMTLHFEEGAILLPQSGVTVTILSAIDAGRYPIFNSSSGGSFVGTSQSQCKYVYAQWFGASGSDQRYTVSVSTGSPVISFSSAPDFKTGQGIKLLWAGSYDTEVAPETSPPVIQPQALTQYNPEASMSGSTTYQFVICRQDTHGAISGAGPSATVTDVTNVLNRVQKILVSSGGTGGGTGIAIYGLSGNPPHSQGLLWFDTNQHTYANIGWGPVTEATRPPWIPSVAPSDDTYNYNCIDAVVMNGAGSTSITINTNCLRTFSECIAIHDDTIALNAAASYLESCGGGTLYFPTGAYQLATYTADSHSLEPVYVRNNVTFTSDESAEICSWMNPGSNNGPLFSAPNSSITSGWELNNLGMHSHAYTDMAEFGCTGFSFYASPASTDAISNFKILNCTFHNMFAKPLDFQNAHASYYSVMHNTFTACDSNALGVGGSWGLVEGNFFYEPLNYIPPPGTSSLEHSSFGGECIIGSGAVLNHYKITNNFIQDWGPISIVNQSLGNDQYTFIEISNNICHLTRGVWPNGSGAIDITGDSYITVSNNVVQNTGKAPTVQVHGTQSVVTDNIVIGGQEIDELYGVSDYGGLGVSGDRSAVSNNVLFYGSLSYSGNYGTVSGNTATAGPGYYCTVSGEYNSVIGNITESSYSLQILPPNLSVSPSHFGGATISGNTCGQILCQTDYTTITGNTVDRIDILNGQYSHSYVTISGNRTKDIFIQGDHLTVEGNTLTGGISAMTTTHTLIVGNTIYAKDGGGYKGVISAQGDGFQYCTISNNIIDCANITGRGMGAIFDEYGHDNRVAFNQFFNVDPSQPYIFKNGTSYYYNNTGDAPLQRVQYVGSNSQTFAFGTFHRGDVFFLSNPSHRGPSGYVCTVAGIRAQVEWKAGAPYVTGTMTYWNGNVYRSTASGTSGTHPPITTTGTVSDGGVIWQYVGPYAILEPFGYIGEQIFANQLPTSGSFALGDRIWNANPVLQSHVAWVCMTAGTACDNSWTTDSYYSIGTQVYNNSSVYQVIIEGPGPSTMAPVTGTTSDGYEWALIGPHAEFGTFGLIGP